MTTLRSRGMALGVVALAAAAFAFGRHEAHRGPSGPLDEIVRSALSDPDPIARAATLVPVLRQLDATQIGEVERVYEASFAGGGPGSTAIALLCEAWAALDPQGALDQTSTWPRQERRAAREALLRGWARRNRNAAIEFASGIHDDGAALRAVFTGWAETDDPAMWTDVAKMKPSMGRESASIAMMQRLLAREGYDGLFARVQTLPDDGPNGFKTAAIGTATALVATFDPTRAMAFADQQASTPNGGILLRRVAIRWVAQDGPAAMQNLVDRPASPDRDFALRETYRRWLRAERAAALGWMPESAPTDARYTPLLDLYAVALARSDPQHRGDAIRRAIRWAERTADADKRRDTFVQLGVMWLYEEPDAASAWLAQNGLEEAVRQEAARYEKIGRTYSGRAR
ncbi:MAG TPA: hypothetical protein VMS55_08900 [Myxococcota bacterium]|nr:hypothetical protein [Myxococcota bacterium]